MVSRRIRGGRSGWSFVCAERWKRNSRNLRSKADEGREFVKERARKAREQASDLVDRGREVAKQQKEQFKSAYEAGRQAYHEATAADGGASKNL